MKNKSYVILNMSDERNKGDFAILKSIVDLLRTKNEHSNISVINVDLSETDIKKQTWTRMLNVNQLPAVFPQITNNSPLVKSAIYLINIFLAIVFFLIIVLFQNSSKYFLFFFPERFKKVFSTLNNADKVFLKGGSFLYDYGGLSNSLYFLRMIYPSLISIFLKKDLYVMGVSIGPIKSLLNQKFIKFLIKHSKIVILRELISYNFIRSITNNENNIFVFPDMALFGFYKKNNNFNKLLSAEIPYPKNKMKIAITARTWEFPQSYSNRAKVKANYISVLTNSLKIIQDRYNAIIYFMPHNIIDIDFESLICKNLEKDAYVLKGNYALDELVDFYSHVDYTIGVRLHSCILSLAVNTPALHIAYMMNKGLGTYKLLNLENYVVDATNFSVETVLSKFELMTKNREHIVNSVSKLIAKSKQTLLNNILYEI